jgi:H+/Cl- antiporter ClcA
LRTAADVADGVQPRAFLRLKLSPPWQLALGGAIVGLLSLLTPKVWGNGYSVVQAFLLAPPLLSIVAGVFICKLLAVLASSGSARRAGCSRPRCLSAWRQDAVCAAFRAVAAGR